MSITYYAGSKRKGLNFVRRRVALQTVGIARHLNFQSKISDSRNETLFVKQSGSNQYDDARVTEQLIKANKLFYDCAEGVGNHSTSQFLLFS